MLIGILYDVFRLLRLSLRKLHYRHSFYAATGALAALTLIRINGGSPRLYVLVGIIISITAYFLLPAPLFAA